MIKKILHTFLISFLNYTFMYIECYKIKDRNNASNSLRVQVNLYVQKKFNLKFTNLLQLI